MQFTQFLTSLKICLECTPPLIFPDTLSQLLIEKRTPPPTPVFQSLQLAFQWNKKDTTNSPSQYFNVGSTLFERCGSTLKLRWSDVENETKSDVGFSSLDNVDTTSVSDVQTTLKQRWYNFISTLFQRDLNFSKSYIETNGASDKYEYVIR